MGNKARNCLSLPFVTNCNKLEVNVNNELRHYMGFIRFQETYDKTLFARFRPVNNIITLLAPHFADRFPTERIIIADVSRRLVASIDCKIINYWQLDEQDFEALNPQKSDDETLMNNLWKCFTDTIEIKERRNLSLQRNNMPLRYREFM